MSRKDRVAGQDDQQRLFALSLVTSLGMEGAIRECWENQWLGTLHHVEALKKQNA